MHRFQGVQENDGINGECGQKKENQIMFLKTTIKFPLAFFDFLCTLTTHNCLVIIVSCLYTIVACFK